jgi:hypothetical protein
MKHLQEMKRNLLRRVLGSLSLTTAAFIFQACYGTPQDFGLDVYISGTGSGPGQVSVKNVPIIHIAWVTGYTTGTGGKRTCWFAIKA